MAKTQGDELFERYLRAVGADPGEHEQDLSQHGIVKKPDYLPTLNGSQIACEVEGFTPGNSPIEKRMSTGQVITASSADTAHPIRASVKEAAAQLKPLTAPDLPLVVVLANTDGAMIDLTTDRVVEALYGDLGWVIEDVRTDAPSGHFEHGRNGKLTNDHPYISAVAVLHRRTHEQDRIAELAETNRDITDFETASTEAEALLRRVNAEVLPDGDYLWLEVVETISETAVPVPDHWFRGPRDERWRLSEDRTFARV